MDPIVIGIIGIVVFFLLLFYGVHIAVVLGTVGLLGLTAILGLDKALVMVGNLSYTTIATFDFAVIPMFILMGMLVSYIGLSSSIYNTLANWVGKIPGGLGVATIWSCAAFGTLNGSATVTASVFARACAPEMTSRGYHEGLTYGMISAAGNIGQFIPPSVLIVVYGALSGDSIGRLLMAGVSPGLGLAIIFSIFMVLCSIFAPKYVPRTDYDVSWKERIISLKNLIPIAIIATIIIGGIFGGVFSSAEAGAIGSLVLVIYGIIKKTPLKQYGLAMLETIRTSGMTFIILICASFFAKFMTISGLATAMIDFVNSIHLSNSAFLFMVVVVYLILGCFVDAMSSISITLPLFYPVAISMGIDPIHFAMVALLALHCGGLTPPVGMCVFTVKAFAPKEVSLMQIFAGAMPFLGCMLILIVIYILVPSLSTFLPNYFYG